MKINKIILTVLILSMIALVFTGCGGGGSVTPPISDNTDDSDSEEIELIEIASAEINLDEGGIIEVTDPESELYGLKLTIEPQKNIRKDKGLPVINIVIYLALLETCKLPNYQGFLITPFIIKSDFTDALFGKLEIPYYMEQLINSGVAINAPVKVCRVSSSPLPWEELSSDKYTVSNNIVNIPIGLGDFMYYYTLTVNNAAHPNSSGFKSPQPGDLLYKFSKLLPAKINEGWCSGHVGIYVGERYDEEEEKSYNVIEALLGGVTRSYHSPISEFGGDSIYLGAREPEGGLSHLQRNKIVAFTENAVGTPYSLIDTLTSMIYSGLGRGNLVKGYGNDFNCVGLAEAAYESEGVGVDLVSNYDEGNEKYGPYHILTPAEQWYRTVPATGLPVLNVPPEISNIEVIPEGSVNTNSIVFITCNATDQDKDNLTYIWTIPEYGNSTTITKGKSISWGSPNEEGTYIISCKVIDNYGGEDEKSINISVGDINVNHAPDITSTPVTSATKDEPYSYDVNATDSDENTLTYSLTTKPIGMNINSSTGMINWTPTATGDFNVTVKVSDNSSPVLSDTQSFTITVSESNHAPVITSTPVTSATKDEPYSYNVTATDADGDTLVYSLMTNPSGMTINGSTGLITWTPTTTGSFGVTVKVSDGELFDTQIFTVTVSESNHAPNITSTAVTSATKGQLYSYDVNATDADGDTLVYSLTTKPSGMTINSSTGLITWTPTATGSFGVTVKVSDGELFATQSFIVIVEENGAYSLRDIGPAGGRIFYDKGSYSDGWRYLEAAPASTEWTDKQWGSYGTLIGGTKTGIGTGQSNTTKIVTWLDNNNDDTYGDVTSKTDRAAYLCDALTLGDYNDWFLPSKDELNQMYANLYLQGVGGFADRAYWSSSEGYANYAWGHTFYIGYQYDYYKTLNGVRVRAVRAF